MINNLSMLNVVKGKSWILNSLLLAVIILNLCSRPVNAAQLRDIRIGEYEGFTRIVFEVDTPSARPRIEIDASNNLWVAFDRTNANLIRKIPVERSRHIKSLEFWRHNETLSTLLVFDYSHFRHQTFPLSSPPRIAVDIFPAPPPPVTANGKSAAIEKVVSSQPKVPSNNSESLLLADKGGAETGQSGSQGILRQQVINEGRHNDIPTQKAVPLPKLRTTEPEESDVAPPAPKPSPTRFRLQFFLVIGLVVITIGILSLLLLMLFARHRFSEVKSKLSASEFLRQQDKKLAALNSRIKEQFERYDEA